MKAIHRQWPLLAVVFISMTEIAHDVLFLRRVERAAAGVAAGPGQAVLDVLFILSRIHRAAAMTRRSASATQIALDIFCLEYFFKGSILLYVLIMLISRPDLAKKDNLTLTVTSNIAKIMFFTPIIVGWCLKTTLDECKLEENIALKEQRQQHPPSPARPEETAGQLSKFLSWPRNGIILFEIYYLGLNLLAAFGIGHSSSIWHDLYGVFGVVLALFILLTLFHRCLHWTKDALTLQGAVLCLDEVWSIFFSSGNNRTFGGVVMSTTVHLLYHWTLNDAVQELDDKDTRVATKDARIATAAAEKAPDDAVHKELQKEDVVPRRRAAMAHEELQN